MSGGALRAAAAVFVIGLLVVWLIRPIGNACPDIGKLPAGSKAASAPSFAPPLTRTCTYTTQEGTKARKRYVPVVDVLALALVAALVGAAIGLAGPRRAPRAPKPEGRPKAVPARAPAPSESESDAERRARDAAERERARQEREARRRG